MLTCPCNVDRLHTPLLYSKIVALMCFLSYVVPYHLTFVRKYTLRKYANAILSDFHGCKNDHFPMKKVDIFLIFAQNIY